MRGILKRKEFIRMLGAKGRNWTWSWSFINEERKEIIFGAWTHLQDEKLGWLILSDEWVRSPKGRKNPGYAQSIEHIRLLESGEYKLMTFPMIIADRTAREKREGPAKIKEIIPELSPGTLLKVGVDWYSSQSTMPTSILPDEVVNPGDFFEGAHKLISVNVYERNALARKECIRHYGKRCIACHFNFEKEYGKHGADYIHVHHLKPLSEIKKKYSLDPIRDLRPICPNCHAMIHRRTPVLSIEELQAILLAARRARN